MQIMWIKAQRYIYPRTPLRIPHEPALLNATSIRASHDIPFKGDDFYHDRNDSL